MNNANIVFFCVSITITVTVIAVQNLFNVFLLSIQVEHIHNAHIFSITLNIN